jgi:hypothetical protein
MTQRRVTTKAELLADIEQSWAALNAALDRLNEAQLTTIRDAQGWTVKDHLSHLAAWERSVAYFLQGRPRHEGLGIDEKLYLTGSDDAINAAIQAQRQVQPLAETLAELRAGHAQLMALLHPLTDADLPKPYRHYLPDEPGAGDWPAINVIYGNTAHHFGEHLGWVQVLVAAPLG